MRRFAAALLAASLLPGMFEPVACATAQAAGPFETVPVASPPQPSHRWAYLSLAAGAGLVGLSFALTDHANRVYDEYLGATDPGDVQRLYDESVRFDRLSATALFTGEALVAAGIYLRFLRAPRVSRVSLDLDASRCAVSLRF